MGAGLELRRPQLHEVEGLRFSPEAFARVQEVGIALYEEAFVMGRQDAAREIDRQLQFAAMDARTAAEWIAANAKELASSLLNDRMVKALQQALIDGIALDLPVKQIVANALAALGPLLGEGTAAQPTPPQVDTIVRTILTRAYNEGRRAFFEDERLEGYVEGYMWSAVLDERTTDFCRAMDGKKFAVDDPIWRTLGAPPAHFGCRSLLVPITINDTWKRSSYPKGVEPAPGFGMLP